MSEKLRPTCAAQEEVLDQRAGLAEHASADLPEVSSPSPAELLMRRLVNPCLRALVICLVSAGAVRAAGSEKPAVEKEVASGPAPGHSLHGEAFNEGPRQAASLLEGCGKVSFPVTTKTPQVQQFVNQGVGQLHGFWYFEAERSFRQAAALDPQCAIAYWGMAMANINNEKRAKQFIAEASKRADKITPRERLWIDALAEFYRGTKDKDAARRRQYVKRLENIIHEYPDDLEAKAFLAVQIWLNSDKGIPIESHEAVNALIEQVLAREPRHSVHHYRIHLWDKEKPAWALGSAALCGPSAPTIAHMWHMPGHTYSGLHRYADAAWQQEASSRVDHAHMIADHVIPDQIHNYAHNQEWLIRNLNFLGQARKAIDLAKNLIELPRHPRYNKLDGSGSAHYGRLRLLETLERYELWKETLALADTPYLKPEEDVLDTALRRRVVGSALFATGDVARGQLELAALEALLSKTTTAPSPPSKAEAPGKDKKSSDSSDKQPADKPAGKRARKPASSKTAPDKTVEKKRKALEQSMAQLRGWEATALGNFPRAAEQFEKSGLVQKEFLSRAWLAAGDRAKAEKLAREAAEAGKSQFLPLANHAAILAALGRTEDADRAFDKLRSTCASFDLDLPIVGRLETIAKRRQLAGDWRVPRTTPDDIGPRPPLESLGPWRWHPFAAADWKMPAAGGKTVASSDYRGQPVVMIFYLGLGCIHCVEQLKTFGPRAEEFRKQGIELVAIGTDAAEAIQESLAARPEERDKFKFPLLADPGLDVFKRFGALDDFEHRPLHATLLVDAAGRVRWQDISYEPFTNAQFLIEEAQRLLSLDAQQSPENHRAAPLSTK